MPHIRTISLYQLGGITDLSNGDERIVLSEPEGMTIWLRTTADDFFQHLRLIETQQELTRMAFMGAITEQNSNAKGVSIEDRFREVFERVTIKSTCLNNGPYLEVSEIVEGEFPNLDEIQDFGIAKFRIQRNSADTTCEKCDRKAKDAIAAISIAMGRTATVSYKALGHVTFITNETTELPVYLPELRISAWSSVHRTFKEAESKKTQFLLSQVRDLKIAGIVNLLGISLDDSATKLWTFQAAWIALETFVSRVFKDDFEEHLWPRIKKSADESLLELCDIINSSGKEKLSIRLKFTSIAHLLDNKSAQEDIKLFQSIKKTRDRLNHYFDVSPSELPINVTQDLVKRYLMHYVELKTRKNIDTRPLPLAGKVS